jgi:hypothetical protein
MGHYNNFNAAIAAGRKGESLAANYLIDLGYFIEDVRDRIYILFLSYNND